MDDPRQPHGLLNIFVVEIEGRERHLIGFLEPNHADEQELSERAIVGEFTPDESQEFNRETFALNPAFVEAFTDYMNAVAIQSPAMHEEAARNAGGWLYVVDPRSSSAGKTEPTAADLLGGFRVDDLGKIVPDSFVYNEEHDWFDTADGVSGVLSDRTFYDWLHAARAD